MRVVAAAAESEANASSEPSSQAGCEPNSRLSFVARREKTALPTFFLVSARLIVGEELVVCFASGRGRNTQIFIVS